MNKDKVSLSNQNINVYNYNLTFQDDTYFPKQFLKNYK